MRQGSPGRLKKRDVERLLEEIDVDPKAAVARALCVVLGLPIDTDWLSLVDKAAQAGDWPPARREELRAGTGDALFDLAAELNERRTIARHT